MDVLFSGGGGRAGLKGDSGFGARAWGMAGRWKADLGWWLGKRSWGGGCLALRHREKMCKG